MDKEQLKQWLIEGKSTRKISELCGLHRNTVSYYVKKYELGEYMKYKKPSYIISFNKIDSKEKAYIIGYFLADGYLSEKTLEFGCALADREILDWVAKTIGANIQTDNTYEKEKRRFPKARISIGNKDIITDINKHCSSKNDKHVPIIPQKYKRFLVQGFFDGDGCITWGHRKDRNRLWHKISFTSQYKVLEGIQNILLDEVGIASKIKPKGKEKCFVLEFANRAGVIKFLNYIYPNDEFIILRRKFNKAKALRLELGEFGEGPLTPSEATEE